MLPASIVIHEPLVVVPAVVFHLKKITGSIGFFCELFLAEKSHCNLAWKLKRGVFTAVKVGQSSFMSLTR